MGGQTKWAIRVLASVYAVFIVGGCVALTFDRTGTVGAVMESPLFPIPFFGKPVIVTGWKLMGAIGALMFAGRWVVQVYYARKAGRPVTPLMFWVMSLIGSNLQLVYFIWSPKNDMVGVLGNFVPSFVAAYNLFLEIRNRARAEVAFGDGVKVVDVSRNEQSPVLKVQAPVMQIAAQETAAGE